MMSYWGRVSIDLNAASFIDVILGYKFETLCLIPDKWDAVSRDYIENRDQEVVNNNAQYCSVVRTGIGNASIIIGGEVDAGMSI